ncbi:MAG: hypothetical protein JSV91_12290 [Phycisphaerales bacterium]|nr:MAG: hypothetical protein JSV91_12290 [Phycisphaerales bacterium]
MPGGCVPSGGSGGAARSWGLIDSAGIAVQGPMNCMPPEEIRRQLEVKSRGGLQ